MPAPILTVADVKDYRKKAQALGVAICEACGLDPNGVQDITIRVPAGELVTVDVTLIVRNPEALLDVVKHLPGLEPLDGVSIEYKQEDS